MSHYLVNWAEGTSHLFTNTRTAAKVGSRKEFIEMVGTTGFEPATSRTPSVRATRLRHVPSKPFQYGAKTFFVKHGNRLFLVPSHRFELGIALIKQIEYLAKLMRDLLQRTTLFVGK